MTDSRLVVVVTGANRGIGLEVVRQLLLQTSKEMVVYLTARDIEKGHKAFDAVRRELTQLQPHSPNEVRFHQLDALSSASVRAFVDYLTLMHGEQCVDVLINNAGGTVRTAQNSAVRSCDARTAAETVRMNYFTAVTTTTLMEAHMRAHGRVLFMASALAHLGIFSGRLPRLLASDDLTLDGLNVIENGFISAVRKGSYPAYGFPPMPFAVAKAGLVAYARLLARRYASDPRHLFFAAICPGYVRTDRACIYAPLTVAQGAETPVYLALVDIDKRIMKHNGELWKHLKPIKW